MNRMNVMSNIVHKNRSGLPFLVVLAAAAGSAIPAVESTAALLPPIAAMQLVAPDDAVATTSDRDCSPGLALRAPDLTGCGEILDAIAIPGFGEVWWITGSPPESVGAEAAVSLDAELSEGDAAVAPEPMITLVDVPPIEELIAAGDPPKGTDDDATPNPLENVFDFTTPAPDRGDPGVNRDDAPAVLKRQDAASADSPSDRGNQALKIRELTGGSKDWLDFGTELVLLDDRSANETNAPVPDPQGHGGTESGTEPKTTIALNLVDNQQRVISELVNLQVGDAIEIETAIKVDRVEVIDPEVVEAAVTSPRKIVLYGRGEGTTQVQIESGSEHQSCFVIVGPNYKELENLIRAMAPTARVKVSGMNGTVVLTGRVSDSDAAQQVEGLARAFQGGEVLNHLTVAGVQQTMLRVVVAEVNKEATRALGINWGFGASRLSRDFFFANNIGQINPTNYFSNGLPNVTQGQLGYSVAPTVTGALTNFTFGFPRAELQLFLSALRENGFVRTLAEPNLVAISGQTATFLAGGEVPIPVAQGGAVAGAITIIYKEFGVRLAFTPTVLGGQLIRIHVMTEISDPVQDTRQVGTVPLFSFRTRRVETTIECGNGQSFAIAGLLNDQVSAIASKIPGLGDMPVLGALFSSVEYQKNKTELVVLVTPELVEPMEPLQVVPPPGAHHRDPSDAELFGLGMLEGAEGLEPQTLMELREPPQPASEAAASMDDSAAAQGLLMKGDWGLEDAMVDADAGASGE